MFQRFTPLSAVLRMVALVVLCAGCQSVQVAEPLTQKIQGADDPSQMAFWHALADAGPVSHDTAFHAVLLYFDGQSPADAEARRAELTERGWLPADFNAAPDAAVTRGTLAVILANALEIDGGLVMGVFGPSPRYATRELQFLELYPECSQHQLVSGIALVELMSKIEDHQRRENVLEPLKPKTETVAAPESSKSVPAPLATAGRQHTATLLASLIGAPRFLAQMNDQDGAGIEPVVEPNALPVVITSVAGMVQVRPSPNEAWQPAKAGQELTAGAEFRTGPRSVVQFQVGDTQVVTLDRLGTVKVLDAIKTPEGDVKTDVGLKYGRTSLQVQAGGVEHQSSIRSAGATLAVRGSLGVLEDVGQTLLAAGLEGDVAWSRGAGRFIPLPPSSVHERSDAATAQRQLRRGTFDPSDHASQPQERELYAAMPNGRFEQQRLSFDSVRRLLRQADTAGVPSVAGMIAVVLNYRSLAGTEPANVNLGLDTPLGKVKADEPNGNRFFFHSGNRISKAFGNPATERIVSAVPIVPRGSYSAVSFNEGPANAGIEIEVKYQRSPDDPRVTIDAHNTTLAPGQIHRLNFQIPQSSPK